MRIFRFVFLNSVRCVLVVVGHTAGSVQLAVHSFAALLVSHALTASCQRRAQTPYLPTDTSYSGYCQVGLESSSAYLAL